MKIKKQPDLHQYTIKNSLSWANDLLELHAEFPSLAIANPTTGEATCANPCASVDDADGSINDQARLQRV